MSRKPDLRTIALLIVAGFSFTVLGRKRWKLLNRIKKTISSKIANAPLGEPAEIRAKVFSHPEDLTVSPLTKTTGAAFIWQIDEWTLGFSNRYHWEACSRYHSIPYLYFTEDGHELAGVDLEHAEFIDDIFITTREVTEDLSPEVTALVKENDLMILSKEFPRKYRIKEKVFHPGEELFIHGLCTHPPISYLHTILGKAKVGRRASHKEADGFSEKEYLGKTRIFFRGKVYLTEKSEKEAMTKLLLSSLFFLITGPAMLILGLYLLISPFIK